ncbi:uncharacterized protein [Antedon mediterranea]|uniref:uncharacterized protein n=1 Tax=Antedon mediterranea TaxID=105859 RepID=UPI003AF75BFC
MSVSTTSSQDSQNATNAVPLPAAQQETCAECIGLDDVVSKERRLFSSSDHKPISCVEHQENMISKRCEKMYTKWKRSSRPLVSSNDPLSEISTDGKFTIGLIGKEGGHLEIRNGDIQLYIPPGSLSDVDEEYVFMYADSVHHNLVKYDVIICGPPGLQFNNSVLLRFPNPKSQDDERSLVKLSVQELGKPLEWRSLDTTTDGYFFLEDGKIMLHMNHFTGIKVNAVVPAIQQTVEEKCKAVYVTAFLEQQDQHYFLFRVFCSTYCALKLVNTEESERGSRKMGNPVKMGLFQPQDEVTLQMFGCVGCLAEPTHYSICVDDVLSDLGYIHRQFVLESLSTTACLKFQVDVGSKTIHIERVKLAFTKAHNTPSKTFYKIEVPDHRIYQEPEFTCSPLKTHILSPEMRRELSMELDVLTIVQRKGEPKPRPCDYRGLAELMGMSARYINWLEAPKNCRTSSSPTILLLNTWEIECSKRQLLVPNALKELEILLIKLGKNACIEIAQRGKIARMRQFKHRPRVYSAPPSMCVNPYKDVL